MIPGSDSYACQWNALTPMLFNNLPATRKPKPGADLSCPPESEKSETPPRNTLTLRSYVHRLEYNIA